MRAPCCVYAVVILAVLAPVPREPSAMADDRPPETRRTISVTGQGEVSVSPDVAILSVAVETTASKAAEAVSVNASRSAKVSNAVKGLTGKDDKVTTTRYALEPRYEAPKHGEAGE